MRIISKYPTKLSSYAKSITNFRNQDETIDTLIRLKMRILMNSISGHQSHDGNSSDKNKC